MAAARAGLQHRLPLIGGWIKRSKEIAEILSNIDGVSVNPNPVCVNFFQIFLKGDPIALMQRHHQLAAAEGVYLFHRLIASPLPGYAMTGSSHVCGCVCVCDCVCVCVCM